MSIDDYKIIKKLGKGIYGTTFLVKNNNKKYAMKIEKILESDIPKSYKSTFWREIEFAKRMGTKYPDHFMTLYDYDIVHDCKYRNSIASYLDKKAKEKFQELIDSPYCSRKIYSIVDTTFDKYISKLTSKNQIYSIAIQLCYIGYLMFKNGYTHNDLHFGNIGIVFTDKKYIKVFDRKIPTFGILVQLIDYGLVKHKKYKLTHNEWGSEKKKHSYNLKHEFKTVIKSIAVDDDNFFKYVYKVKPKIKFYKIAQKFYDSEEGKKLRLLLNNASKWEILMLFRMVNHLEFQKYILGNKFKRFIKARFLYDTDDLIFICKNYPKKDRKDIKVIIDYFLLKMN